jgi:hypothetical protein
MAGRMPRRRGGLSTNLLDISARKLVKLQALRLTHLTYTNADVSTDREYRTPPFKQTASQGQDQPLTYIEEWQIFSILDHLRPTAAGLDLLPAWFLRLAAPFISKPLAFLINKSLATSTVPSQWKTAWIKPIPKIAVPKAHADYRPISITPILTRMMEKTIVSRFLYPTLLTPPPALSFNDQFAFRPSGSTTAALITMLHKITHILAAEPYVIVMAIDFSKVFDCVRHAALMEKMAQLDIPDHVYNITGGLGVGPPVQFATPRSIIFYELGGRF